MKYLAFFGIISNIEKVVKKLSKGQMNDMFKQMEELFSKIDKLNQKVDNQNTEIILV